MKRQEAKFQVYPKADDRRSGCKVGWLYYSDEATARVAAEAAWQNGQIMAARGYDFGYCCPGSCTLRENPERPEAGKLWEVCIP